MVFKQLRLLPIFFIALVQSAPSSPVTPSSPSLPRMPARRSTANDVVIPEVVNVNPEIYPVADSCSQNARHPKLALHRFHGQRAPKCTDGTLSSFYMLRKEESKDWVIFLPGGSYCADRKSCADRMMYDPDLTSSKMLKGCREGRGILSSDERVNPYLHHANMVYIPYCSSDLWSGTARNVNLFGHNMTHFMGAKIVHHTVRVLARKYGLRDADRVFVAGTSAGGIGVLTNIDRVKRYLETESSGAVVRGIVDSAWYLLPKQTHSCRVGGSCSMVALLKRGANIWRPRLNQRCEDSHKERVGSNHDAWKCFFGPNVYKHIQAPLFIVQNLFDVTQIQSDGLDFFSRRTSRANKLDYFYTLHANMVDSLKQVKSSFAPSCIAHSYLNTDTWTYPTLHYVNMAEAIDCWSLKIDQEQQPYQEEDLTTSPPPLVQAEDVTEAYDDEDGGDDVDEDRDDSASYYASYSYDEYYYDEIDSPAAAAETPAQRAAKCQERLVNTCRVPQCSYECPLLQYQVQIPLFNTNRLHRLLYPNVYNPCQLCS